jgi:hypothetical protein
MAEWEVTGGPDLCQQGNFDGDVWIYKLERGEERKTVYVRARGTLIQEIKGGERSYPDEVEDAVRTKGKAAIAARLRDATIPRCITFNDGRAEPQEDDEHPNPCSEP